MPTKSTSAKKPLGRPPHAPTAALRRKVATAAGAGMRHEDIAVALGISRPTLDKHYAAELSEGALGKRLEVIQALHAAAKRGSSSAAKAYLQMEPQLAAPPAPDGATPQPTAPPRPAKLGKKEQAQADASTAGAGTEWADLLPGAAGAPLQ